MLQYNDLMCKPPNLLAVDLDPRVKKRGDEGQELKQRLRREISQRLRVEVTATAVQDRRGPLFRGTARAGSVIREDEVDRYCQFVGDGSVSCSDISKWWREFGVERFPVLSRLARTVFMTPSSSVTSEAYFSRSGKLVRVGRCRRTRRHVTVLMKRKRWYNFMGLTPEEVVHEDDVSSEW